MRIIQILVLVAISLSHQQAFGQSYKPLKLKGEVAHFEGEAKIFLGGGNFQSDFINMFEEGYVATGVSDFDGSKEVLEIVLNNAKEEGTEIIVISPKHAGVLDGIAAIPVPSHEAATKNASEPILLLEPELFPDTVEGYHQTAAYYSKPKVVKLGILMQNVPSKLLEQSSENVGSYVLAVMKGSPVSAAGITTGDIVKAVNGEEVDSYDQALSVMRSVDGNEFNFTILRDGTFKEITVISN